MERGKCKGRNVLQETRTDLSYSAHDGHEQHIIANVHPTCPVNMPAH